MFAALSAGAEAVEKASIDEAFVDLTAEVDAALAEGGEEEAVRALIEGTVGREGPQSIYYFTDCICDRFEIVHGKKYHCWRVSLQLNPNPKPYQAIKKP